MVINDVDSESESVMSIVIRWVLARRVDFFGIRNIFVAPVSPACFGIRLLFRGVAVDRGFRSSSGLDGFVVRIRGLGGR